MALVLAGLAAIEVLSAHGYLGLLLANPSATIGPLSVDLVLLVAMTLPVALRRVRPVLALAVVLAVHVIANLLVTHHFPFFGGLGSLAILTYSFGRHAPRHLVRWGWLAPMAWAATFPVRTPEARDPASVLYAAVLLTLPWVAGMVIRRLSDQHRALDVALRKLSALEEARHEAALLTERARIAREMHDVLAHGVTVMVIQTGAARLELPADSPARGALLTVEATGRTVLGELRRTVGLLRSPSTGDSALPQPGLRELPTLVESMRTAGLDVNVQSVARNTVIPRGNWWPTASFRKPSPTRCVTPEQPAPTCPSTPVPR